MSLREQLISKGVQPQQVESLIESARQVEQEASQAFLEQLDIQAQQLFSIVASVINETGSWQELPEERKNYYRQAVS